MRAQYLKRLGIWCIFCILLALGFMEANAINRFHGASLRFNTPITGQAAYRARQYSISNAEQNPFWPTFWHESVAEFTHGTRTVPVSTISFSGDAALIWPADFIAGSAPSVIDARGVAVSESFAHRLWGSTDIIGMSVYVDQLPRIVRGVFKGTADIALLSFHIEDTSQSWTAVELAGGAPNPTRNNAESFAMASGLGRPDYVLMGGAMALARFMAIFPILIPTVYALAQLIGFIRRHYRIAVVPAIFAGLILLAVSLPFLLYALPAWLIPTHWSDFSFWSQLSRQAGNDLREFLSAPPSLRDVELKLRLLRQVGILILSVFLFSNLPDI